MEIRRVEWDDAASVTLRAAQHADSDDSVCFEKVF